MENNVSIQELKKGIAWNINLKVDEKFRQFQQVPKLYAQ